MSACTRASAPASPAFRAKTMLSARVPYGSHAWNRQQNIINVRSPARPLISAAASKEDSGIYDRLLNPTKPFGTKWQWEFRAKDKPDATCTAPWLLMSIKLVHYFTLVAQGTLSYVLFAAADYLTGGSWAVGGVKVVMTQLEVFVLVLGSVYQAAAGGFFIMAHEYDGWEIGHFAMPDNQGPNVDTSNNDRLRLVAYQLLWMFQGLGMGVAAYALQCALARAGLGLFAGAAAVQSSPVLMGAAATALVTSWFVFATWEPNFSVKFAESKDSARSPWASLIVFILVAIVYASSITQLVGPVTAYSAVACFALGGGLFEAFLTEGTLEQWFHLLAVTVISIGSLILILGLCSVCGVDIPWVGDGPWGLSACGWWYVMLAGVAALMIGAAKKMPSSSS